MTRRANVKLVLELRASGLSRKMISRTRKMSMHTVMAVFDIADERDIGWSDVKKLTDDEAYALLFPEKVQAQEAVGKTDYDYVHEELKKPGVTLKLLWQEYRARCKDRGSTPTSYTSFTRGYSDYVIANNVTNHLNHKPGQAMEVDWSGTVMNVVNPVTGALLKAYLFVAVLPYSQYTYVEATQDMKQDSWLACHVHAYDFFGGVAIRLVCDNLKTGVTSHPRSGEIVLNEAYESLARHYVTAIMPTQVRKPKQKASVEGTVGKLATAVVARLRNEAFTSYTELNVAIRKYLDDYNAASFQKRDGSRREVFEAVERGCLAPLPASPYEICQWVYGRSVNLDFHVVWQTNRYSVPYTLVGGKVDLKLTDSLIEIYDKGRRVASHPRFPDYIRYKPHTCNEHMPPEFTRVEWDDKRILRWASDIGSSTQEVVTRIFSDVQIKEQAYNPALSVLNLSKPYGTERLEAACAYALTKATHPRYRFLKSVLASGADKPDEPVHPVSETGGYVRGPSYFSNRKEDVR